MTVSSGFIIDHTLLDMCLLSEDLSNIVRPHLTTVTDEQNGMTRVQIVCDESVMDTKTKELVASMLKAQLG